MAIPTYPEDKYPDTSKKKDFSNPYILILCVIIFVSQNLDTLNSVKFRKILNKFKEKLPKPAEIHAVNQKVVFYSHCTVI